MFSKSLRRRASISAKLVRAVWQALLISSGETVARRIAAESESVSLSSVIRIYKWIGAGRFAGGIGALEIYTKDGYNIYNLCLY